MIIPNQMVQISINSKNKKYYEKLLNKTLKIADVINVSPENLMHGSCAKFYAKCDRCGNEKEVVGQSYFKAVDKHDEYLCEDCHRIRDSKQMRVALQTMTQKELEVVIEKRKATNLKKYGVDNPAKNQDIKNRMMATNIDRYGGVAPACSKEIEAKMVATNLKKYGVKYTTQDPETRQKMLHTSYERYGYYNPGSNPEFQSKARKIMYENGTCPTSKQQYTIYKLLVHEYGNDNCKLNYPCLNYNLDCMVCIDGVKIDIEYDGWHWHRDSDKDQLRNQKVQNEGYKILRVKSGSKIPNIIDIQNAINNLLNGSNYEEIVLDDWPYNT